MPKALTLFIPLLLAILTGCSREKTYTVSEKAGVKSILNTGKPAKPELQIRLDSLFTLHGVEEGGDSLAGFTSADNAIFDSEGSFFVLSITDNHVLKFDKNGRFIRRFGRQGNGPGEFVFPQGIIIVGDTVKVLDAPRRLLVNYDNQGNFLFNQSTKECNMPVYMNPLGKERITAFLCNWRLNDKKEDVMDYDFAIIDKKFNILHTIYKQSFTRKQSMLSDILHPNATNDSLVFFSVASSKDYTITAYDCTGKKLYTFAKPYREIRYTREEQATRLKDADEMEKEYLEKYYKAHPTKTSIENLHCDNTGRVWVIPTVERTPENSKQTFVDIFENGIFLNRVSLPAGIDTEAAIQIHQDRLIAINYKDLTIKVFKYTLV